MKSHSTAYNNEMGGGKCLEIFGKLYCFFSRADITSYRFLCYLCKFLEKLYLHKNICITHCRSTAFGDSSWLGI